MKTALDAPLFPLVIRLPQEIVIDRPNRTITRRHAFYGAAIFLGLLISSVAPWSWFLGITPIKEEYERYKFWRASMGLYCIEHAQNNFSNITDSERTAVREGCAHLQDLPVIQAMTPARAVMVFEVLDKAAKKIAEMDR